MTKTTKGMTRGQLRNTLRGAAKRIADLRMENEQLKQSLAENTVIAGDLLPFLKGNMKRTLLQRFTGWLVRRSIQQDKTWLEKPWNSDVTMQGIDVINTTIERGEQRMQESMARVHYKMANGG